ncbi:MAG: 7-cyano-7-deazaguanine synthase QueC [Gemmatimonadetes bacterium]|nr:7-cyano-7-deazaguanine synthase QueC [Gemmatimonadota bacterium]|tara:strand:+ start:6488 stop:7159 length:672 start_codon:yes stop_codon:yes gene_type:complete
MSKELAVVLLSGGLDSCVTAAVAAQSCDLALLHLSYGQRTEAREVRSFKAIADHYDVSKARRLCVEARFLERVGGSALTNSAIAVPEANLDSPSIPITYVPFRNAHLISLGVSWAEVLSADAVYIGVVEEDSSGYPDCREDFCRAFEKAIDLGTRPETRIRLETPLIHKSKADIVSLGVSLQAPLDLTWSCYSDNDRPCGRCESCSLRARAFGQAGVQDPILS